jgi:hypothetical protein
MSRRKLFPRMFASAFALAALTFLPDGLVAGAFAQTSTAAATAAAVQATAAATTQVARITGPVDDSVRVPLKGNVHPLAQARFDQGAAPASMPTGRLALLLAPSAQQHEALKEYLDSLQNPSSPNYHKWLTPATYGASYGASEQDIATVSAWLTSHGFKIEKVATARNIIQFSGSIAQVTAAFHTPIHSFLVNGEHHFSNTVDPQIPAALAPVIAAISPLNDFHPRRHSHLAGKAVYDTSTKSFKPQLTLFSGNTPNLFVGPADAAVIYNTPNSTLNAGYGGTTYDGTGVTIGIAGDSDITVQDVANYRAAFLNDTNTAHLPTTIIDGDDPGVVPGDAVEALLDTEVSGGIAPGATVNLYTAADTDLQDGLFLAIGRALQDNVASILNVSFGECEEDLGNSGNSFVEFLWEEAAAQGVTVTVSTGDSGSAGCDDPGSVSVASDGLAVNGLASTPYDIAVGGTDYLLTTANFGTYVQYLLGNENYSGAPPYYVTALSYIPESPWNDSINTPYGPLSGDTAYSYQDVGNISAGSGGVSAAYPKPAFQSALTPGDSSRDLPDVSLLAANGQNGALWTLCSDNVSNGDDTGTYTDCQVTGGLLTSSTQIEGVGGTSASAPAFAGMLALVSQSLSGARLGQANTSIYRLANTLYSTIFHDVTQGNNSVPCVQGSVDCALDSASQYFITGFNAGSNYDLASGLGSVNAAEMVSNWNTAGLIASTVSLTANGNTNPLSITHGQSVTFAVTASPSAATGDVSINDTSGVANNGNAVTFSTLSGGTTSFSANTLPGGSYNIYAYYGGDTNYAGAASNSIAVVVGPENSTTALAINAFDATTGNAIIGSTFPYGAYAYADAQSYGNASTATSIDGYPTGTVTFAGLTPAPQISFNSLGYAEDPLYTLGPGSYTVTAQYSGDVSFNPSSSSAQSFTIIQGATAIQLTTATATTSTTTSAFKPGAAARPAAPKSGPVSRLFTAGGGVALGCLLLLSVPARRRAWKGMVAMLALVALVGSIGLTGCGGSSSSSGGGGTGGTGGGGTTPTGTYTVTALLTTDSFGNEPTGNITLTGNGNTFTATSTITGSLSTTGTDAVEAIFTVQGSQLASGANTLTATYAGDTNYSSSTSTVSLTPAITKPVTQ